MRRNRQRAAVPAPDPFGVVEAVTGGAVRDPLRVATEQAADLDAEAAAARVERETPGPTEEPSEADEGDEETVERAGGREVRSIL